ncbi:MAG: recombinase family protein [Firmicutes bacterium]|nr:recombinase family protein [Bacillota bacterium]
MKKTKLTNASIEADANHGLVTAIYVRVSTEEQAKEGYSIRAQIEKLKSYIRIKDWSFYKVYSDEGISGKNISDRPAVNELIQDIKDGKVNNVLVYKIDRLTRNTRDLIDLTEIFKENNCVFNSLMESIDTQTASGRMFLKIIGIFAEFERENLIERLTLAFEKKAKEGYSPSSRITSYGYDRDKGNKIQEINPKEAEIVREIFSMYVDGNLNFSVIAKNLNNRNIKTKQGKAWNNTTIKNLLTNPNYIGKVRYSILDKSRYFETEGKHEAILRHRS